MSVRSMFRKLSPARSLVAIAGVLLAIPLLGFDGDPLLLQLPDEVPRDPDSFFDQLRLYKDHFYTLVLIFALFTVVNEDAACVAGGLAIASGIATWTIAVAGCMTGIMIGDTTIYLLGYLLGRPALNIWPLNRWLTPSRLKVAEDWFGQNGDLVLILSRFTPGLRFPIYFSAGLMKVPVLRFLLIMLLAVGIWTPGMVALAVILGTPVMSWLETWGWISALLVIPVIILLVYISRIVMKLFTVEGRRKLAVWVERTKRKFLS